MSDLQYKVLDILSIWMGSPLPKNTYVYGKEGEIYVRWTPALSYDGFTMEAQFTLANVTMYEGFRGNGLFKEILKACCESDVPVVRLECILNPRLARFAKASVYPGRETSMCPNRLGGAPSVDWRKRW